MSDSKSENSIRLFADITAADVGIVGGKGANLGEMTRAGLPVPPGFCVTAQAYRTFIQTTGAMGTIRTILDQMQPDSPEDVESKTQKIRDLLIEQSMPWDIGRQIIEGYRRLAETMGMPASLSVAVRSSATAEDLPTASFAGQQDTYLNIRGEEDLLAHVKRCWASLWTARAVTYRIKQRFEHEQVALAVVVQAMIPSEVSGILFTANPINNHRDETVVNASWGLGEAIVSGVVNPDTFIVSKKDRTILSRDIATKDLQIQFASQGSNTVELPVPAERQNIPALTDDQIAQLVSTGNQIEAHYGMPMDIEWAYAGGKFYVLQARAITTLTPPTVEPPPPNTAIPSPARGDYNRSMFLEIFPDPLSPIFLSVIQPLFHAMVDFTFETLGFKLPQGIPAIGAFYNQPYFNQDYIAAALEPLSPPVRERMVAQIVNPFGRHDHGIRGEWSLAYLRFQFRLLRFMIRFPPLLPGILDQWHTEIKKVTALPVQSMSDQEIVDHIRNLVFGSTSRLLNYDYLMIALIGITYQTLGSLLGRYFGDESEEIRSKLISGVTGNVTMETNKRIWDLAQTAKRSPAVCDLLRQFTGQDLMARLEQLPEGRAFLEDLDHFLAEYGHREVRMDILYPTWGEDPTPVLSFIRAYLDVGENQSPHAQQRRLVQEREALARTVQMRLDKDWTGRLLVGPIFRWVLKNTQAHTRERDTMHFELTRLIPPFRRLLSELGRRWTAKGILAEPSDIFFLTLEEVTQVAQVPIPAHEKAAARRAEFEESRKHSAPSRIRDGQAILGAATATTIREGEFHGIAGSPGRISGIARIIRGPEEFAKLQSGEILVAPLTNPVWTPLFAIAGGLVTEVGGILSHGAIVAREYGIPAVMAVPGVTKSVKDGQRLTVDGSKGLVFVQGGDGA